ncbi:ABC transporter ATP-binding protein [Paenibacillus sp. J5C_2022]|nr:ABC transporter ATP-binding protein [Paenibacillus sp. J5C2022]MCU6708480.1 ABC transporter ATP-binding protein [Paenibacillus sp. J5C2022]
MIDIRDLTKRHKMGGASVNTLDGISLQVERGEFVAIVGPSGSGKTTLMNMIGCLDLPDSGSYMLDDVRITELTDNKLAGIRNRKIGFIFQSFHLLPKLTALDNVELPLIYGGVPAKARKERALRALEQVGLKERVHHRPSQLSGGQQQRVAIARALVTEPPLLLADEPTGALDIRTGQEVLALIERLHANGHTIVLITHDKEVAMRASRVLVMRDGRLSEGGGDGHEAGSGIPHGSSQHLVEQA